MQLDVKYPQITGVEGENIDKINEMLKDCAMSILINTLYLAPSDSMKEKMLEESNPFLGSLVTYKVSYAGEDFISVASMIFIMQEILLRSIVTSVPATSVFLTQSSLKWQISWI